MNSSDLDEYQKRAASTVAYPNIGKNYIYPTFGLADESGEVVGKIKMSDVAKTNLEKLSSRAERGKLQGSGDNR